MGIELRLAGIASKALERAARLGKAIAAEMQKQRGEATQPPEPRVFRASVVRGEKDPAIGKWEEIEVRATSPEDAAERRCGALSEQLLAFGKFRSRTFDVIVDGQTYHVNAALSIKTEVQRRDGGPKWGA